MDTHEKIAQWIEADRELTRKGVKRYGLLTVAVSAAIIFVASGMPGHFLWRWVGIPLVILFALTFTPFLFYFGRLLWGVDW